MVGRSAPREADLEEPKELRPFRGSLPGWLDGDGLSVPSGGAPGHLGLVVRRGIVVRAIERSISGLEERKDRVSSPVEPGERPGLRSPWRKDVLALRIGDGLEGLQGSAGAVHLKWRGDGVRDPLGNDVDALERLARLGIHD